MLEILLRGLCESFFKTMIIFLCFLNTILIFDEAISKDL